MSKIDKVLRGLPVGDKIGALIVCLSADGKDAIGAIKNLISAATILGQGLPDDLDRLQCSKVFRECATEIEHAHRPLVKGK